MSDSMIRVLHLHLPDIGLVTIVRPRMGKEDSAGGGRMHVVCNRWLGVDDVAMMYVLVELVLVGLGFAYLHRLQCNYSAFCEFEWLE